MTERQRERIINQIDFYSNRRKILKMKVFEKERDKRWERVTLRMLTWVETFLTTVRFPVVQRPVYIQLTLDRTTPTLNTSGKEIF